MKCAYSCLRFHQIQTTRQDECPADVLRVYVRTVENPCADEVSPVPRLKCTGNVAECEFGEAVRADSGANRGYRKQNKPRDRPDDNEDTNHHAQEAHEEVGVKTIDVLDSSVVRIPH